MKYSALYSLVAGLALGAMLLPGTALAEKRTPFTSTENDDMPQNFPWFPGTDGKWYVFDGRETFEMVSDEPRVAGRGEYSMYAIMDLTGALTLWGKFHCENTDGAGTAIILGLKLGLPQPASAAACMRAWSHDGNGPRLPTETAFTIGRAISSRTVRERCRSRTWLARGED